MRRALRRGKPFGWWVDTYVAGMDDWITSIWFLTRRRALRFQREVGSR